MSNKEIKQIIKEMTGKGWTSELRNSGHYRLTHPCGKFITLSATPRCKYAVNHIRGDIKRLERTLQDDNREFNRR